MTAHLTPSMTTLLVRDLDASLRFYVDGLGLDISTRNGDFVEFNSASMRLALFPSAQLAEYLELTNAASPSKSHSPSVISLSVTSVQDLNGFHRSATERGVPVVREPANTPWGQYAAFYLDPDRNLVEVHVASINESEPKDNSSPS